MGEDTAIQTASFELPLAAGAAEQPAAGAEEATARSLARPLLMENAAWFCRLRWLVVAFLTLFGLFGQFEGLCGRVGVCPPGLWPFIAAGILTFGNVALLIHICQERRADGDGSARLNLWSQIVLDLLVLTAVIHFIGSTDTYISFTYLFHIVLACVFFSRGQSFAVTLLAIVLYAACILLEVSGMLPPAGIFRHPDSLDQPLGFRAVNFFSAAAVLTVVWYLTSHLSELVRRRDHELASANVRLEAALVERARHMLVTTHELKAPFAAIHANTQLLRDGYCGDLPNRAREILRRITARCRRLTTEIQEMLQLANLRSVSQGPPDWQAVDLAGVLRWSIQQTEAIAADRDVAVVADLEPTHTAGVEDHLKMMFINLVNNAVMYSRPQGRVTIRCTNDRGPVATITDEGIGIAPKKLPRIFDEHYRTNEAVSHNKESSGLGLAIVRQVAQLHGVRIRVDSRLGQGTTFELRFSSDRAAPVTQHT
ncbi:MAG: sensor histidine kinase [Planctomycetota bacterium]|jgi:signal transduction histidine kinase